MHYSPLFGFSRRFVGILLVSLVLLGMSFSSAVAEVGRYQGNPAKYVFLFIGDGMGIPQRTAAEAFRQERLIMDTFPVQGITTTHAADRFITGSAASATALGAGQKTNIGMVGVSPSLQPVKSLGHLAKERGMKVGVVSSVSIDHATPAAFYAHVPARGQYYDIDVALAESGFDFFGGGGLKDPTNKRKNSSNYKGDARNIAKRNGYKIVTNKLEFMNLTPKDGKVIAWNNWLQDSGAMPYEMDRRPQDISLVEFTQKAIEILDNPNGFFLMVEAGKIDWAGHANDAAANITNTIQFDDAIKKAVAFSRLHPGETLIVVTGDHECGGLTLGFAGTKYATHFHILKNQKMSYTKFDQEVFGPFKKAKGSSARFGDVKGMITENFGLKFFGDAKRDLMVLKPHEIEQLQEAFKLSMAGDKVKSGNPTTALLYGGYEPLTVTITHILNQKAGLAWTSYKHTGVPVSTSAMGAGAELFNGYYDNTEVALKIMAAMGIPARIHVADAEVPGAKKASGY